MIGVNPEPNDVLKKIFLNTAVSGFVPAAELPKRRPMQTYEVKMHFGSDYAEEYGVASLTIGNVLSSTINEYFIVFKLEDGDEKGFNLKTILTYNMVPNKAF